MLISCENMNNYSDIKFFIRKQIAPMPYSFLLECNCKYYVTRRRDRDGVRKRKIETTVFYWRISIQRSAGAY